MYTEFCAPPAPSVFLKINFQTESGLTKLDGYQFTRGHLSVCKLSQQRQQQHHGAKASHISLSFFRH